ncbi:MAG: hypothetical protein OXL96_07795 [Candidatus Poribacteria bacterium]|nr:hypothetical protein [Candidatus Poribacteria bacterium]
MEENVTILTQTAVFISTAAAAISALFAGLAFLFSRRVSRREMVDILKMEILQVVSTVQGREGWLQVVAISRMYDGGAGPRIDRLAGLLGGMYQSKRKRKSKYQKDKWMALLPIALEELKKEGYKDLLGM